ncbi:MAG: hypothetical protein QGG42_09265, partial [Phycisphaerae bacterium]|nr:hypothetical protein [Phycisphaerae bacterium]
MKLLTHRSNWLLGMLVILAVLLAAGSAPAQNANADQAAGIRDRIRDLMETSRQEWHKGYDAALRADRGGGASAEADKEIAYQAAGAAEEQALMHAEQAGPVAEALYWREKQQTLREQRDRWPAGAPAFDSATDLIDNYGDKAFAKLMEAQRGAATDPEMRQQLHDYYREEAA